MSIYTISKLFKNDFKQVFIKLFYVFLPTNYVETQHSLLIYVVGEVVMFYQLYVSGMKTLTEQGTTLVMCRDVWKWLYCMSLMHVYLPLIFKHKAAYCVVHVLLILWYAYIRVAILSMDLKTQSHTDCNLQYLKNTKQQKKASIWVNLNCLYCKHYTYLTYHQHT